MMPYVVHGIIGAIGAGIGFYARGFCAHKRHTIALTAALVAVESVASVRIVG